MLREHSSGLLTGTDAATLGQKFHPNFPFWSLVKSSTQTERQCTEQQLFYF